MGNLELLPALLVASATILSLLIIRRNHLGMASKAVRTISVIVLSASVTTFGVMRYGDDPTDPKILLSVLVLICCGLWIQYELFPHASLTLADPCGPGEKKRRKKSLSESGSLSTSEPTSESKPETLEVPQDNDGDEQQHVLVYEAKAPTKLQGRRVNLPVAGRNKCNLSNCAVCLGSCSKLQAKARHYTPCPDDLTAVPCCYQGQNHSVSSEDASEGKGFVGKLLRKGKHALGRESKEGEDGRLKGAVKATKAKMNDCLLGCRQKLECEGIPIDETLKQGDFDLLSTNGSMYKPEEAGSVSCPNIFPSCPVKCDKSDKPKDEPTDDATTQASEPEKKEGFFPRMWGNLKNRSAALFKRAGEKLDKPDDQEVASEETEEAKPTKPKSRWWWPLSKDETEAEEGEEPRSGKKKPAPFVIKVSVGFNINEMCCALVTCAAAIIGLLYYFKAF